MRVVISILIFALAFAQEAQFIQKANQAPARTKASIGVENVQKNEDGSYVLEVFLDNQVPIAGFQFDILPRGFFEILEVTGGEAASLNFMSQSSKQGTVLGFSMQGKQIPTIDSPQRKNRTLTKVKIKSKLPIPRKTEFSLNSILASKKGQKVEHKSIPFQIK